MGKSRNIQNRALEAGLKKPGTKDCGTQTWRVLWEIDIEAISAEEAAGAALVIMRDDDPANTAGVFQCIDRSGESRVVDLLEISESD